MAAAGRRRRRPGPAGRPAPARALHPPHGARAGGRGGARPGDRARWSSGPASAGPGDCWATQLSAMDWSLDALAAPTVHQMLFSGYRPGRGRASGRSPSTPAGSTAAPCRPRTSRPGWSPSNGPALRPLADWAFRADDYPTSPVFVPRPGGERGGHDGWVARPGPPRRRVPGRRVRRGRDRRRPDRGARRAGWGHRAVPHPLGLGAGRHRRARARAAALRGRPDRRPSGGVARRPGRRGAARGPRPRRRARRARRPRARRTPAARRAIERRTAWRGGGPGEEAWRWRWRCSSRRSPAPSRSRAAPPTGPTESSFTISDADSAVEALAGEDTTLGVIPDEPVEATGRPIRIGMINQDTGAVGAFPELTAGRPRRGRLRQRRAGRRSTVARSSSSPATPGSRPRVPRPAPSAWSARASSPSPAASTSGARRSPCSRATASRTSAASRSATPSCAARSRSCSAAAPPGPSPPSPPTRSTSSAPSASPSCTATSARSRRRPSATAPGWRPAWGSPPRTSRSCRSPSPRTTSSPTSSAAAAAEPDAIIAGAADAACVPLMKRTADLAVDADLFLVGACAAPQILDAVGDGGGGPVVQRRGPVSREPEASPRSPPRQRQPPLRRGPGPPQRRPRPGRRPARSPSAT